MPLFLLPSILGRNTPHYPGFTINRPEGHNSHLLMCFQTPFVCATRQGMKTGQPGNCIIHSQAFPQWHSSVPGSAEGFVNDWIHFTGTGVEELMESLGLQFDTIIPTGAPHILGQYMESISNEMAKGSPHWRMVASNHLVNALIDVSRRSARYLENNGSDLMVEERLLEVRRAVAEDLRHDWNVEDMARLMCLSPSRFRMIYKEFFNITPFEDLLRMRLERAKAMLSSAGACVGHVAEMCGFSSLYYFSRFFKARMGYSPSQHYSMSVSIPGQCSVTGQFDARSPRSEKFLPGSI